MVKVFLNWLLSDNPTYTQRRNRANARRWWRKFIREGELIIPFLIGLCIFSWIVVFFLWEVM
jgi:ABC-type multidrug transport system permease subunit